MMMMNDDDDDGDVRTYRELFIFYLKWTTKQQGVKPYLHFDVSNITLRDGRPIAAVQM